MLIEALKSRSILTLTYRRIYAFENSNADKQ